MDPSTERILTAVIDRIIPGDDFPSASQAGVMTYIKRILTLEAKPFEPALVELVADIDTAARNTVGKPFVDLNTEQQDGVLRTLESTPAFHRLVGLTSEGFYADPGNGGNLNYVSWKMVGYKGEPS